MQFKFDNNGLIPAIAQDAKTKKVLMLAYMNQESIDKTISTGKVHYYSRSRKKLWLKGETSGHFQFVKTMSYDCDEDAILVTVDQIGVACHTGQESCFYRNIDLTQTQEKNQSPKSLLEKNNILLSVYNVITDRRTNPKEGSYTNYLLGKGIDKVLKKVGEEAAEVIIASKNPDDLEVVYEVSDLMYHLSVLLVMRNVTWEQVFDELNNRR